MSSFIWGKDNGYRELYADRDIDNVYWAKSKVVSRESKVVSQKYKVESI